MKFRRKEIEADIVEIETVELYTGSYDEVVNQGQKEVNRGYEPPIKNLNVDLKNMML